MSSRKRKSYKRVKGGHKAYGKRQKDKSLKGILLIIIVIGLSYLINPIIGHIATFLSVVGYISLYAEGHRHSKWGEKKFRTKIRKRFNK